MEIVRYWVFQVQHTFQYLQGQNHAERYRNLGIAPFEAADAIEDAISSTSCWLGYGLASLDLVCFYVVFFSVSTLQPTLLLPFEKGGAERRKNVRA